MKNLATYSLSSALVLALIATACTYEMPTVGQAVGGQGGSGGNASSSSSSSGLVEDCLDGMDNDEDGAIDCADSDCTDGFTCTEVLPDGWTKVTVETGNGEPPPEELCANGDKPETLFTGPAGAAECEACECGTLEGTTCRPRSLVCFPYSGTCNSTNTSFTSVVSAAECTKPDLFGAQSISCRVPGMPIVDEIGECLPSVADFANKYPWTGWVRACPDETVGGGGCLVGSCIPKPGPGVSTCIRKDGSELCPAGWNAIEAYAKATDDRSCGVCTCTPEAQCSGGGYEFFDFNDCIPGGTPSVTIVDSTCQDATNLPDLDSWSIRRILPEPSGSCVASGGEPLGSVVPENPVTICCK
jgi:hypothetical protein